MANYNVGRVNRFRVSLATAVAARRLSPRPLTRNRGRPGLLHGRLEDLGTVEAPGRKEGLSHRRWVYDNLGPETAWKRYRTILISDGGGVLTVAEKAQRDGARHSIRVLMVIDNQVRSLRKRQLLAAFRAQTRLGTYWGIRSAIVDYRLDDPLWCDPDKTVAIAAIPTRLKKVPKRHQMGLINWGYAICDTALRRWVDPGLAHPRGSPYPRADLS